MDQDNNALELQAQEAQENEMSVNETPTTTENVETVATSTPKDIVKAETPIISLKNINIYQKNILILPQISMSVRKGEFVYLIGKTGSGKSSILKTLIAEVPAEGDEAYINGFNLLKLKKR